MTPRKTLVAFLAILMVAQVAVAQKAVVTVNQPGTYLVSVVNGQIAVEPIPVVVIGPSPVVPVDPIVPVDPTLSPDAQAIKAAASAATADPTRAETAGNLAEVMKMVKAQVDSRTIKTYPQIAAATNWLMDSIIGKQTVAWKPTKDLIGQRLAALGQQGAQPEEYAGFFADAAEGFEASVPLRDDGEPLERIDIDKLMKLFEFFIKYILPFIL
jgi:hypothetical protein